MAVSGKRLGLESCRVSHAVCAVPCAAKRKKIEAKGSDMLEKRSEDERTVQTWPPHPTARQPPSPEKVVEDFPLHAGAEGRKGGVKCVR